MEEQIDKDWKLKLRYGKLQTPYQHFTLLAEGIVGDLEDGFSCPKGSAIMGMKVWATDSDEAADMIQIIGENIGFTVTGKIEVYSTDPVEPPGENPHGYDIKFTPYKEE
jgi:hypothetical protein